MNRYLSEYIRTLSDRRVKTIHSILRENTLSFDGLSKLVSKSRTMKTHVPGKPTLMKAGAVVDGLKIGDDFSRTFITVTDYEKLCNELSLIFHSTKELHETRISDLAKQLQSLEKLIRDFAFLYSGDPGFNWSWSDDFRITRLTYFSPLCGDFHFYLD